MRPAETFEMHRAQIRLVVKTYRASNPRVFGSVAPGVDTDQSDVDILVHPTPETTLFDIGAMRHELRKLLGFPVDVLTPNSLPEKFRDVVLAQASPV